MTKYAVLIPTMIALMAGFNANEATAQGIHFRSGGVHIDVGHPHHGHRHHGYARRHGGHSYGTYRHGRRDVYGGWGGHHHWHDTTHLDYHPGSIRTALRSLRLCPGPLRCALRWPLGSPLLSGAVGDRPRLPADENGIRDQRNVAVFVRFCFAADNDHVVLSNTQ